MSYSSYQQSSVLIACSPYYMGKLRLRECGNLCKVKQPVKRQKPSRVSQSKLGALEFSVVVM